MTDEDRLECNITISSCTMEIPRAAVSIKMEQVGSVSPGQTQIHALPSLVSWP